MNKIDRRALALAEMVSDMIWGGEHGWEHASDEDFSQLIKTARKRLSPPPKGDHNTVPASTSDDGGDREEVEPVAWRYEDLQYGDSVQISKPWDGNKAIRNIRPLYAHPPTPQDSGLADELTRDLEAYDSGASGDTDPSVDLASTVASNRDIILTALRQPRNDGELLEEIDIAELNDIAWKAFHESEKPAPYNQMRDAVRSILARLDQGEG